MVIFEHTHHELYLILYAANGNELWQTTLEMA